VGARARGQGHPGHPQLRPERGRHLDVGLDIPVVEAYKTAGKPFVPIVGADNNGFIGMLLNEEGLEGAAVTNPPPVGGAGLALALKVKNGEEVPRRSS
jgi:ribose transport system substrate-binding protein